MTTECMSGALFPIYVCDGVVLPGWVWTFIHKFIKISILSPIAMFKYTFIN